MTDNTNDGAWLIPIVELLAKTEREARFDLPDLELQGQHVGAAQAYEWIAEVLKSDTQPAAKAEEQDSEQEPVVLNVSTMDALWKELLMLSRRVHELEIRRWWQFWK